MAGVRGHRRIAARYRAPRWLAHLVAAQAIPAASRCRRPAVASIISALRPGGWMLAEDPDSVTPYASETDVVTRVVTQRCRYSKPSAAAWTASTNAGSPPTWPPRPRRRPHRGQGPPSSRWLTPSGATGCASPRKGRQTSPLLRRRHRGSASRHVSSSPGPRFHHLRPYERRILGTPGSLTLGNQADSAASSLRSAIRARKEQSAANWGRHTDRMVMRGWCRVFRRGLPVPAADRNRPGTRREARQG